MKLSNAEMQIEYNVFCREYCFSNQFFELKYFYLTLFDNIHLVSCGFVFIYFLPNTVLPD